MHTSTSSSAVNDALISLFTRFGLLETIVMDNGTRFVSQEFEKFPRKNGVSTQPLLHATQPQMDLPRELYRS